MFDHPSRSPGIFRRLLTVDSLAVCTNCVKVDCRHAPFALAGPLRRRPPTRSATRSWPGAWAGRAPGRDPIAEALNISRGPVSEAFKLLRAEGLLREERNRGTYVVRLSSADVHEIYDLRAAIESRAAKLLARAGRPDDLETLNTALGELEAGASLLPARQGPC